MTLSPLYPQVDPLKFSPATLANAPTSPAGGFNASVPQLSDPSSLIEQINGGLQNATQNFVPLEIPGVGLPDTQPQLITGLPSAINAYQSKYTQALPSLQTAINQGTITPQAVNALSDYDRRRILQGQSPLGAQASAGALQTVSTGQAATPNPHHSVFDVFGNAGRDLKAIVSSVPHIPSALYSEATHLGDIPSDIANAPNPLTGLLQAHGIRLIPGAYTLGNLAEGGKGLSELAHHPLMTGLDITGLNAEVGHLLSTPEETAAAHLAGERVPGVIGRVAGEPIESFKTTVGDFLRSTHVGQWADAAFGAKSRAFMQIVNNAAYQVRAAMDPALEHGAEIIDPEGIATGLGKGTIANIQKWQSLIGPDRMRELTTDIQLNPDAIPNLADHERAFLDDQRAMTDRIANYHLANGELEQMVTNGQMEVLPPDDANTIRKQWTRRDRYETGTAIRQLVQNPSTITYDDIQAQLAKVQGALADDRFSGKYKTAIGKGYGYAIRNLGGTLPDGYLRALSDKDFATASDLIASHTPTFDSPIKINEIKARERWAATTRAYTPGNFRRAAADATEAETNTLPARWREWRDQIVQGKITSHLQGIAEADRVDVPALVDSVNRRNYRQVADAGLLTADDLGRFNREAAQMIADMKTSTGESPLFVHRMDPEQIQGIKYGTEPVRGTLQGTVKIPSQLKSVNELATPYVHDVTVAMSHEMQQVLTAKAQRYIYSELLRTEPGEGETLAPFARTRADLERQYAGVGENRLHINPTVDTESIIQRRINQEWQKFPIERLPADLKVQLGLQDEMGEAHPYIPRGVYRNLQELDKPHTFGVFDKVMKVFRTALLPLSPRFLLYHMLGGAVQLAGQTDPLTVWKYIGQALRMSEGELPSTMRPILGNILEPSMQWEWEAGGTMRRLLGDSPLTTAGEGLREGLAKVVNKSYSLVSFFQDTYRTMGYLYGYDKAITAGMTAEQAAAAGEALARKALMTWDDMTAIERTGMRSIFPFYGFARHVLQYAERYPIEHPFRAAVISTIARNELNDLGTGLPQTMMNMLFLGHPDSHGHVRAINTAALNPFRDVANMTTLAGWLSATNPVISGILQSAGLDTTSGGPDLYPNLQYDTETGRLAPISTNPLLNIAYQTVPQAQILGGMLAKSSEYKDLMRLDPSSAMRLIASQGGIPMTYRDLNVDRTMIQDEVTREAAQKQAFDDALKTGDWSQARRWPLLAPQLNQVQSLLQSGALSQFQPGAPNSLDKLQQVQQMIASSVG